MPCVILEFNWLLYLLSKSVMPRIKGQTILFIHSIWISIEKMIKNEKSKLTHFHYPETSILDSTALKAFDSRAECSERDFALFDQMSSAESDQGLQLIRSYLDQEGPACNIVDFLQRYCSFG